MFAIYLITVIVGIRILTGSLSVFSRQRWQIILSLPK
jgi:hypothetical protein